MVSIRHSVGCASLHLTPASVLSILAFEHHKLVSVHDVDISKRSQLRMGRVPASRASARDAPTFHCSGTGTRQDAPRPRATARGATISVKVRGHNSTPGDLKGPQPHPRATSRVPTPRPHHSRPYKDYEEGMGCSVLLPNRCQMNLLL